MVWSLIRSLLGGGGKAPPLDTESPEFAAALERAKEAYQSLARPAVALDPRIGEAIPEGPASSIGGRPSLPPDMDWPTCPKGRPMLFLAQVNYGDMPAIEDFPSEGLLSFFVPDGAMHGLPMRSGKPTEQRILWFEDPTHLTRRESPARKFRNDVYGKELRRQGAPLAGRAYAGHPPGSCFEFDEISERFLRGIRDSDPLWEWVDELDGAPLHYGGYPDFTQDDIRSSDDDPPLSRVLLQLGWTRDTERPWWVCWGDAGEATFLMTERDLAGRHFDRVTYSWDCA